MAPYANFGPKVMLINGWSGSGGDAFPDYFRKTGLGPLIGEQNLGRIDWHKWRSSISLMEVASLLRLSACLILMEHGLKKAMVSNPDIVVDEELGSMAKGIDPQLERAIEEIKLLIKDKGYKVPATPAYQNRD